MPAENPASSPSSAGTNASQQQQQLMQQMLQMFAGGAGGGSGTVRFRTFNKVLVLIKLGFTRKSLKNVESNRCLVIVFCNSDPKIR